MRLNPTFRALLPLRAAAALIGIVAIAAYAWRSLGTHLWMDELLTIRLIMANNLPKLWAGIALGIDGNPPLYLTMTWLITHAAPASISEVAVLRAANITIMIIAVAILYRISLRVTTRLAAWIGGFLFVALNANIEIFAFNLRTYALYVLMSAAAVLLQLRLIERNRRIDAIWLALCYAVLRCADAVA